MTDDVKTLLLRYQSIVNRDAKDNYEALFEEYRSCAQENNALREKVNNLQSQLEKSMKLNEEWAQTNARWQDLCRRMMEQR